MKTPRFVLAALCVVLLAACGGDSITAPAAPARQIDLAAPTPTSTTTSPEGLASPECVGTLVTSIDALGNTVVTCVATSRGGQLGAGN